MAASNAGLLLACGALAAAIGAALVGGGPVTAQQPAQESYGISMHTFTDSRGVTVLSPTGELNRDFTTRTGLRASFGVDAISAASDSCVRCHPDGANNARAYVNASLFRKYGDTKVSVGGEYSREAFYSATTGSTSISRTLNQANTTIAGGYAFSLNRPVLHPSDEDVERQYAHSAFATITQTVTKTTAVQVGYETSRITGYQNNPFLRATVDGLRMLGNHPEHRLRHSLTAKVRQALPGSTYIEADFRRYTDDWQVRANTWSAGLAHEFGPRLTLAGSYRRHEQTGASFYQPVYTGQPEFFTADFRIFPFDADLYTGRLNVTPKQGLLAFREGTSLTLQYEYYRNTTKFQAATFTAAIRVPLTR
ncbi:MAG: DUF3570 domain-containing protein [Vicinamibacterales bacterium]